jgi:hypothetical protein
VQIAFRTESTEWDGYLGRLNELEIAMRDRVEKSKVVLTVPLCCGLFAFGWLAPCAAETFQNLNFELPVTSPYPYQLPGWLGWVMYDNEALDSPMVSIHDSASKYLKPFQGNYSILLQTGSPFYPTPNQPIHISQIGDVPAYARSIQYQTDYCWGGNLVVSLNGTAIPTFLYDESTTLDANGRTIQTYIGDVSAFAGQENVELKFELSEIPGWYTTFGAQESLDAISFSSTPAPEPSSVVLMAVGMVSLTTYYWLRRARKE